MFCLLMALEMSSSELERLVGLSCGLTGGNGREYTTEENSSPDKINETPGSGGARL